MIRTLGKIIVAGIVTTGVVLSAKELGSAIAQKKEERLQKELRRAELMTKVIDYLATEAKNKEEKIRNKLYK